MSTTLLRHGRIDSDDYCGLADDAPLPAAGKLIVSLARWQADGPALLAAGLPVGVAVPNTVDIESLLPALLERPLIALDFPAFPDGRAYSQARLLAERHRYAGELRATGKAVVRDQIGFMVRCGFTSFSLREGQDPAACLAAVHEFSLAYQPAADALEPVLLRRRRAA